VLIRDVAYAGIPKEARAELHERHADWLDEHAADDALVGYHLEQAHGLRIELGEKSGRTRRLAVGAGQRLGAAGMRAWKQGDVPATLNLLGRSTSLLPGDDALRRELLVELGVARWADGDAGAGAALLERAIAAAVAAHDRRIELRGRVQRAAVQLFTEPEGVAERLEEVAREAIPVFEELGDDRALASALTLTAFVEAAFRCHYAASEEEARRALEHYQKAGWPIAPAGRLLAAAAFDGPTHVRAAIAKCEALLSQVGRIGEAEVSTHLAGLEAMHGGFDRARELLSEARAIFEEYGLGRALATLWAPIAAYIEMLAGDAERAVHVLLESCQKLEELGQTAELSSQAALLAEALYAQGSLTQAESWAQCAADRAAQGDVHARISWRPVRAKLIARRGSVQEAEAVARAAVGLAETTDALNLHASTFLGLAEVMRLAGDYESHARCVAQAITLYERKGNSVAADQARARLADVAVA
jgi:tetratricopeptide (TPR) repeat protein